MSAEPTYRACVDFAYRSLNRSAGEIYITRDCNKVFDGHDVWPLHFDKDTAVFVLAETVAVKFDKVDVVDCLDYFSPSIVREALAKKINKHLARVSVEDFEWLRQRVAFYSADTIKPHRAASTKDAGDT